MMSFSSLAQTQQPSAACTTQECAAQQKNCQTPKAPCKAKPPKADPFAGLTLSESQKTQLNALKAKRAEARAEKMQARKADMRLNDSARIANRRQYLEEVKEIIGPDQYVMYLENIVVNSPRGHAGHHKAITKDARHAKGFSHASKASKANRTHAFNRSAKAAAAETK